MIEVVNAYLSGSEIVVLRRDDSGRLVRNSVPPEFVVYLDAEQVGADFARDLSRSRFVRSFQREGKWLRVGWADSLIRHDMLFGRKGPEGRPSPFEERGITTYEGDVHPVRRWLVDNDVKIAKPRRAYFDLETDSRVPFSRKEEARILSWAIVAPDGRTWSAVLPSNETAAERDMLAAFFERAAEFDQLLAWNGEKFDFPVIRAGLDRCSMRVDPDRWLWLDHMLLFKKYNTASESGDEKVSMKLQSIAMAILGEGKDEFDASKTWQAWEAGEESRAVLERYNVKDTDLLRRIEEKTGSAAVFDAVADVCTVFPESRGLQATVQVDGYMLREGRKRGIHFVTKKYREGASEQYDGAYVMEPKAKGIEHDVHVADFASLYPSIILTWNMSPETKRSAPPNGPIPEGLARSPCKTRQHFATAQPGILSGALKGMIELRKEWNAKKGSLPPGTPDWYEADRKATAYKVVANSFYGVMGSPFSRFFDRNIAESVSLNGRWLIERTIYEAEKLGMEAIYADTDSLFVKNATRTQFETFVDWCNKDLYPRILAETGCVENYIKLAYEKQFRRIVFTSAKRYAGQYVHYKGKEAASNSKPEVKGLEFKRGDTALLARRLQESVIHRLIVDGAENASAFRSMLDEARERVLSEMLPIEEVQISKAVTKPLKDYAVKKKKDGSDAAVPPHVRVAKIMAERGEEVGEGTRVAYVVTDGDGGVNSVIPASDFAGEFDRYYLWESMVYPPTQRFLQAAFPDEDWERGWAKVRPPKFRGRKVPEAQLRMPGVEPPGLACVVVVPECYGNENTIRKLRTVAEKFPGGKEFVVRVALDSGANAELVTPIRVSGSHAFFEAVSEVFWESAASMEWENECAK